MKHKPTSITADRSSSQLTILWDDGHTSIYPFELLRLGCPCVECRGGHGKMSSKVDPEIFKENLDESPAIHLKNVAGVGSYAIMLTWEDGHEYGIYNWQYLRDMCPCPTCRDEQAQESLNKDINSD
ncbi:gamma-butyrobetaine hydroxylase-like domain-containing protein [Chloroflexota bacterium]